MADVEFEHGSPSVTSSGISIPKRKNSDTVSDNVAILGSWYDTEDATIIAVSDQYDSNAGEEDVPSAISDLLNSRYDK